MNTCPVFRRSGGHSYSTTVPGPIGSILAPLREPERHQSLPHACTLCGSCTAVCPVKIDLHEQLLALRQRQLEPPGHGSHLLARAPLPGRANERLAMALIGWVLRSPWRSARVGRLLRWAGRRFPSLARLGPLRRWTDTRELPPLPEQSFHERLARGRRGRT
jgi:L-lactate dehydrogenase complex protein LldF